MDKIHKEYQNKLFGTHIWKKFKFGKENQFQNHLQNDLVLYMKKDEKNKRYCGGFSLLFEKEKSWYNDLFQIIVLSHNTFKKFSQASFKSSKSTHDSNRKYF